MRQPRDARQLEQIERGHAARRLIEDDLIASLLDEQRAELVEKMLSAKISDDETRREAAVEIGILDGLRMKLKQIAGAGARLLTELEERKKANAD